MAGKLLRVRRRRARAEPGPAGPRRVRIGNRHLLT